MNFDSYAKRPATKVQGKCRICGCPRIGHTAAWPVGCSTPGCTCGKVFVAVVIETITEGDAR